MSNPTNNTQPSDTQNIETPTHTSLKYSLDQYSCVMVSTSIDRISASLGYLAQCDYISGNNGDDLDSDAQFGRGYLLDMLGDGLGHFAKNFEHFETLYNKQQQQIKTDRAETDQLKEQVAKLDTIKQKYQQLQALKNKDSEEAKTLQQQLDVLYSNLDNK